MESTSASGSLIPQSLLIPVPSGGRVASSFESAGVVVVSVVFPMQRLEDLIDFYTTELSGWSRSEGEAIEKPSPVQFHRASSSVLVGPCVDVETGGTDVNATCVWITQRA